MPALAKVAREKLQSLAAQQRRRELVTSEREDGVHVMRDGRKLISFSCNDYLGLAHHPQVKAAAIRAIERYGSGAAASRLVTGNHPLYSELEAKLAAWKGTEAALVFGSGYLANVGIIPGVVGKDDLIVADKLVHACLIDGAKVSGAKLMRFKHNDAFDCASLLGEHRNDFRNCLVVTEEVFSMDGDIAPMADLRTLAQTHDAWLMSDSAHGLVPPHPPADVVIGTMSKALGSYGGFVCASRDVVDYLVNMARSLMFSTALPPAVIASAIASLDILKQNPDLVFKPLAKARLFTEALGLPGATSQIVPLILGGEEKTLAAAKTLEEHGYLVVPIRPPAVPEGACRLRFTFSTLHSDEDIVKLAQFIKSKRWV